MSSTRNSFASARPSLTASSLLRWTLCTRIAALDRDGNNVVNFLRSVSGKNGLMATNKQGFRYATYPKAFPELRKSADAGAWRHPAEGRIEVPDLSLLTA